jgi:phytoene/squalene synthetase
MTDQPKTPEEIAAWHEREANARNPHKHIDADSVSRATASLIREQAAEIERLQAYVEALEAQNENASAMMIAHAIRSGI